MKKQPTEQEKIFVNYISDKGLISKICKEHLNSIAKKKKKNNPIFKKSKGPEYIFLQKYMIGQKIQENMFT